jgi:hypothetical protein
MALLPWRFQADVVKGETDPTVTVFVGPERQTVDADGNGTGVTFIDQVTANPAVLPLSQLAAALADPSLLLAARKPSGSM